MRKRTAIRSGPAGLRMRKLRGRAILTAAVVVIAVAVTLLSTCRHVARIRRMPMVMPYPFAASPNCDARPPGARIDCVVMHATVMTSLDSVKQTFMNPATRVSSHFVVARDGYVLQMVPVEKRAWHAGESMLAGRPRVNDYSVGIELVNRNDGRDPYTAEQYEAAAGIIRLLRSRYNIPDMRIVSHAEVALPAGRKSDPAGFDFARLRALAARTH